MVRQSTQADRPGGGAVAARMDHDIVYPNALPFILVHVACAGILWTGLTAADVALCGILYVVRMLAVTGGYHRYFSHRSFKTSRITQFLLALLAQSSAQRGVIWWAAKHRAHHSYSDSPIDPHSPRQHGFWFAHVGWIFTPRTTTADYRLVRDLTRYRELVWLDRHQYISAIALGIGVWLAAGWSGLFVGFILSTVVLYHASFAINSLAHTVGRQRYVTGDDSRNSWLLALATFGEGWHNNHHHYPSATRQGFRWWEIDVTYYVLRVFSWLGVVWDLRAPPRAVIAGTRRPGRTAIQRAAERLVEALPLQQKERSPRAWSADELHARARQLFPETPAMDEIVSRARQMLHDVVVADLPAPDPAAARHAY